MVRFKVIKGSHLLLGFAIAALLGVILFISLQAVNNAENEYCASGARAVEVLASAISDEISVEVIPDETAVPSTPAKRILIYHTHTHEAYEQIEADPYEAIETWRTDDQAYSVVRVGTALSEALRSYGFEVVHDVTDHELDDLGNSYVRALKTLENYTDDFDLHIDLHRDAFVQGMLPCLQDDLEYAQLMLLVGRGDRYSAAEKPDYASNLEFAQRLTSELNREKESICRNVTVKTGRYNQHACTPSILIEFGHNRNTLAQALNSVPIAAAAIARILLET